MKTHLYPIVIFPVGSEVSLQTTFLVQTFISSIIASFHFKLTLCLQPEGIVKEDKIWDKD